MLVKGIKLPFRLGAELHTAHSIGIYWSIG